MKQPQNLKIRCQSAALVATLLFLLFFYFLIESQAQQYQADEYLASNAYGNLLRTQVDRELNSLLFISSGMASYITVYKNELVPAKIMAILKDLWERARHVRNLGVAVGYTVTYVYPETNNIKIIGVDYRSLLKQWPKVKQAIYTKEGVLDGPIDLIQGGSGIIYRYPIYIDGQYWGIISTVIDTDSFLKAAFRKTSNNGFEFAIRTMDNKKVFYGDPRLFSRKDAFRQTTQVPNGQWEWAIRNKHPGSSAQLLVFRVMGASISILMGILVFYFMRERYRLTEDALLDSLTHLPNRR